MGRTGVLLVGFGGPDSLEAVGPFMCNLMGSEPSEELVQRVCTRYLAIGGKSPLLEIAGAIATELSRSLDEMGVHVPIRVGMAYWEPYIREAIRELAAEGCDRVVTVSLSPFESKVAQQTYRDEIEKAATDVGGVEIVEAPLVSQFKEYVEYYSSATAATISDLEPNEGAIVVFTAHSLPESDLTENDPYVDGLKRVANEVAERLGLDAGREGSGHPMFDAFRAYGSSTLPRAWYLVYQSKGNKPGEWLGPELDELIDAAVESAVPAIVCVPIGFLTDHMETLYDLDIVAADRALRADVEFVRVPCPNDHEWLVQAMARAVAAI